MIPGTAAIGTRCAQWSVHCRAALDIAASAVTPLLEQTDRVVPPGTEAFHINLDHVVAELMARSE
ncbi:hypothetical protein AQJ91_29730 [Streptomyces dysideae]|uniref:Uncharacterized protein n=1 Tax=Streptomyces dysideae TaxID=909626 RepID=A0A101UVE7_9ACTN|nr:hypothetical protein AQJ91_29730 [Streptomyces dysideae]